MSRLEIAGGSHSLASDLPQVALTKIVPPAVGRLDVERRRLFSILDTAATRRLVLFKAPAGYGKTSLAATWCQRLQFTGAIVAWLSLDTDDDEPGAFAYHLAMAVERASTDLGNGAIELLQGSGLIPPRNVVSALVNAATESDHELFVLLDDFHVLTDRRCHDLIDFLLRYAPSNFHLVILTRSEPRLPLSRLRLEDEITEIDASLLHFDLSETQQLLGSDLCKLLSAGVAELHASTEGWPAALQLARISLRNSPDPIVHMRLLSGSTHKISEYLEDTLDSFAEDIVEFLLQTSILDHLSGALCEAITGIHESGELLARLERQQFLLIPLDGADGWYRYHHLMREYLTNRLQSRMGDRVAELNRRAYAWYADEGLWTQAVQHAIAAKDFDRAFEFVGQCAMSLVTKGDLLTLLAWERQLPATVMTGQREVKLALAWGMALVTRFKEAERLLVQLEQAADADPGSDLWWRCRAARSIYYALRDDSARGRDLASECLEGHHFDPFNFNALCNVVRYDHLKAGNWSAFNSVAKPELLDGEASYVLPENYRLCLCGMAAAQQLDCDQALRLYAGAKSLAERYVGPKSVAATMVTGLVALVRYERGDVCGAEISVLDTLDLIETTAFHEGFLQAFVVLVRAAVARGDNARALNLLNRAERLSWERGWGRVVATLLVERTRLLLAEGNLQEPVSLLQAFEQLKAQHAAKRLCSNAEIGTHNTIAKGLIAGATGHTADAVDLLQAAYDTLLSADNRLAALRVGLDLAMARSRISSGPSTFNLLNGLLEQAARANLKTFILERKDGIGSLLSSGADRGIYAANDQLRSFVGNLMALMRKKEAPHATQLITHRERSILEYIAAGQSNKEIARKLSVAPETIKTHVKRIFQKLSAETRAQAVVRAQCLGVLESTGRPLNARPPYQAP